MADTYTGDGSGTEQWQSLAVWQTWLKTCFVQKSPVIEKMLRTGKECRRGRGKEHLVILVLGHVLVAGIVQRRVVPMRAMIPKYLWQVICMTTSQSLAGAPFASAVKLTNKMDPVGWSGHGECPGATSRTRTGVTGGRQEMGPKTLPLIPLSCYSVL